MNRPWKRGHVRVCGVVLLCFLAGLACLLSPMVRQVDAGCNSVARERFEVLNLRLGAYTTNVFVQFVPTNVTVTFRAEFDTTLPVGDSASFTCNWAGAINKGLLHSVMPGFNKEEVGTNFTTAGVKTETFSYDGKDWSNENNTCQGTVTTNLTVVTVEYNVAHVCTTGLHSAYHDIAITVNPNPPGTTINLELRKESGTSGSAKFTSTGTSTASISGSTTLTILGTEASDAINNMVMEAKIGSTVFASNKFTVVGVSTQYVTEVLHSLNTTNDTTQVDDTNTVWVCQTSNDTTTVTLGLSWMPTSYPASEFRWDAVRLDGSTATEWGTFGDLSTNPTNIAWRPGNPTNREFRIRSWFDCNTNKTYDPDEPHRITDVKVVDFVKLMLTNSTSGRTVTDVTRSDDAASTNDTLIICESNNGTSEMAIQGWWLPENVNSNWFRWKILLTNEANTATPTTTQWLPANTDTFATNPVTVTWINNANGQSNRVFKVLGWYDCDKDGAYDSDESHRLLYVTVPKVQLIPDYNHDRKIDDADQARLSSNETYRFWINDDHEISDADGEDWPGSSTPDYNDTHPNGVRDLVDFFPVYLDVAQAVTVLPKESYSYIVKQADGALNGVPTTLKADSANKDYKPEAYQTRSGVAQSMVSATLQQITSSGVTIPDAYLADAETTGQGFVMVFEGRSTTQNPLVLEIRRKSDNALIIETEMPLRLSSVTDMYRTVNLRNMTNPGAISEPSNNPDAISNGKNFVFIHGYQPSTATTWPTAWLSEIFKKVYWSGSLAKFHGVSWSSSGGSIGTAYHPAVTNAFCTAPVLKDYVAGLSGDVIVAAHSLGNIVVSSAIVDDSMSVSKYMLCDAAVASEAYDSTMSQEANLVTEWWSDYSNRTWSANWYQLFNGTGNSRANLTWRDRFADVATATEAWNFYSDGDEVFDLTTSPGLFTGTIGVNVNWWFFIPVSVNVNVNFGRYSWQKQEMFKGTRYSDGWSSFGGTAEAGWGYESTLTETTYEGESAWELTPVYTNAAGANAASDESLRNNPVFKHSPDWLIGTNVLSQNQINFMLGMGIPSITPSTGRSTIGSFDDNDIPQYNLNSADPNQYNFKPNGWPTAGHSSPDANKWLHNDMKDVGYYYNYTLFDMIVDEGGLK